jgi:hypothetical protein
MAAYVEVQWELRHALARRDQRFVFAVPLGAHTSAHSSAPSLIFVTALQAAFRTNT